MERGLTALDKLLEDDRGIRAVKGDSGRRYPKTLETERGSRLVEGVLGKRVVKHRDGWSGEQTEPWVNDRPVLRQTCRVYLERVPDDTTLIGWANLIQPQTVQGARSRGESGAATEGDPGRQVPD